MLVGNLALMEGRLTNGTLHFAEAMALAATQRWTAERRSGWIGSVARGTPSWLKPRSDWKGAGRRGRLAGAGAGDAGIGAAWASALRRRPVRRAQADWSRPPKPTEARAGGDHHGVALRANATEKAAESMEYAVEVDPSRSRVGWESRPGSWNRAAR